MKGDQEQNKHKFFQSFLFQIPSPRPEKRPQCVKQHLHATTGGRDSMEQKVPWRFTVTEALTPCSEPSKLVGQPSWLVNHSRFSCSWCSQLSLSRGLGTVARGQRKRYINQDNCQRFYNSNSGNSLFEDTKAVHVL